MDIPSSLIEFQLDRGCILHSTMFENIDHGKFFVIVGISQEYVAGFFFINSRVNIHIEGKQEQLNMQYPLRKKDYSFLHHDSFLCATKIEKIGRSKLAQTISDGTTTIIGNMKTEHMEELLEKARESRLFSRIQKKQFLY